MEQVRGLKYFQAFFYSVFEFATSGMMFAMFVVYTLQGHSLNAHKVYAVITIFSSILYSMTNNFAEGIMDFFKILASGQRVQVGDCCYSGHRCQYHMLA